MYLPLTTQIRVPFAFENIPDFRNLSGWPIHTRRKCILFLVFTGLLLPFLSAQEGTPEEVYQYLTKGYGYQEQMNIPTQLEGYRLSNKGQTATWSVKEMRRSTDSSLVALLIILQPESTQPYPIYLCLPHPASFPSLWDAYQQQREQLSDHHREQLLEALQTLPFLIGDRSDFLLKNNSSENTGKVKASTIKGKEEQTMPVSPTLSKLDSTTHLPKGREVQQVVGGALVQREVRTRPPVVNTSTLQGTVGIKICVDRTGRVFDARYTQKGSTTNHFHLIENALEAARQYIFEPSEVKEQCGIITFEF